MIKHKFYLFYIFLLPSLLFSCSRNEVVNQAVNIPNKVWDINKAVAFDAQIKDIEIPYNVFANLVASQNYETSNIWLIISVKAPSGALQIDTVQFFLSDNYGKWLGEKSGDKILCKFLYQKNIRFAEKGIYHFEMKHAMRSNDLPNLYSAGISIEKGTLKLK